MPIDGVDETLKIISWNVLEGDVANGFGNKPAFTGAKYGETNEQNTNRKSKNKAAVQKFM